MPQLNKLTDLAYVTTTLTPADAEAVKQHLYGLMGVLDRLDMDGTLDRRGVPNGSYGRLRRRIQQQLTGQQPKKRVRKAPAEEQPNGDKPRGRPKVAS